MAGSDEVVVDQSVIASQAREVISRAYNILDELLTNSSDSLFGKKFTEFFSLLPAAHRVPAIPTIKEYERWQEEVKGKYGRIIIRPFQKYIEVIDDGGGIAYNLIDKRIRQYHRSVDDQISMKNGMDFHRRGQFSHGLKEVAVAINDHLKKRGSDPDGEVLIKTVYRKGNRNYVWEGKYYMRNGKAFFTVTHKEKETEESTGTKVTIIYPNGSDNLIPRTALRKYLEENMKLQRILQEHDVMIDFQRTGEQKVVSLFERYSLKPFRVETIKIDIYDKKIKEILDSDFFEIKAEFFSFDWELSKYKSPTSGEISTEMRGIFLHDHTATYGTIDIENNLGTESLQCHVLVPALRVFAVAGLGSGNFVSLVSSNRKTLNMGHPLIELIEEKVQPIWNEEVEKNAAELRRAEARRRSKRTTALNSTLENKMSKIVKKVLAEASQDIPTGIEGTSPAGRIKKDGKGLGQSLGSGGGGSPRKQTFFGPQRAGYGEHILIKVGRERDLKVYLHKDLIHSRMETLHFRSEKAIILDPGLEEVTDYYSSTFNPDFNDMESFYQYGITLKSSWEDNPGESIKLKILLELAHDNPLCNIKSIESLQQRYPNYVFPPTARFMEDGNCKKLEITVHVDIGGEDESNPDSLIEIKWETDNEVKMAADRMENQLKLPYGWTATPSPRMVDGETRTAYSIRIFLKSPFFCDTFDESKDIIDQDDTCKALMASALCSSLAEILIAAKQLTDEEQLTTFREYINAHLKVIMEVIYSDNFR